MNLLSISQVAKQLDYSTSTVRRLPIPYVRHKGTAHRRYKQEDVDKFIQSLGSGESLPPARDPVRTWDSGLDAIRQQVKEALKNG